MGLIFKVDLGPQIGIPNQMDHFSFFLTLVRSTLVACLVPRFAATPFSDRYFITQLKLG